MLDNNYVYGQTDPLRKRIIFGLVVCVVLGVLYLLSTLSFIAVSSNTTSSNDAFEYSLTDQKSGKTKNYNGTSTWRKLIRRGSYELTVRQGESNAFKIVKAGGFFGTNNVALTLEKERERTFVGNNPTSCYQLIASKLYSYNCGADFSTINQHVPATSTQATFTQRVKGNSNEGLVEGFTDTDAGTVALVQLSVSDEGEESQSNTAGHVLMVVTDNLRVVRKIALPDLSSNTTYSIQKSGKGFIVIPQGSGDILRYQDISSKPIKVTKPASKNKNLSFLGVDVQNEKTVFLYGKQPSNDKKLASELIVVTDHTTARYSTKTDFQKASICGQMVCAVGTKGLSVLDAAGDKISLKWHVSGATNTIETANGTVAIRSNDTLRIDTQKGEGFMEYLYSPYSYVDARQSMDGYVLSLVNSAGKKVALLINQTQADTTGGLDKNIVKLAQIRAISDISVYRNYIYISPNYGALEPTASGELDYNPSIKKQVNDDIQQKLTELGLPPKGYSLTNFLR